MLLGLRIEPFLLHWGFMLMYSHMSPPNSQSLSYQDYIEGTGKVLQKSKNETNPYHVAVLGREFIVYPNVFSPKYFRDTELFAKNLPIRQGEELLEVGSGSGVISIMAIYHGAKKVVAIDINPDAVKNTEANIKLHH